jgi:large conductance mechanosensitive channel
LTITLKDSTGEAASVTMNYGLFLQTVIDFTIIAFVSFMVINGINATKRKKWVVPASILGPYGDDMGEFIIRF